MLVQPCLVFRQCWEVELRALSCISSPSTLALCGPPYTSWEGCQWHSSCLLCLQPSSLLGCFSCSSMSIPDTAIGGPPATCSACVRAFAVQGKVYPPSGACEEVRSLARKVLAICELSRCVKPSVHSVHEGSERATLSLPALANGHDLVPLWKAWSIHTRGGQRGSE